MKFLKWIPEVASYQLNNSYTCGNSYKWSNIPHQNKIFPVIALSYILDLRDGYSPGYWRKGATEQPSQLRVPGYLPQWTTSWSILWAPAVGAKRGHMTPWSHSRLHNWFHAYMVKTIEKTAKFQELHWHHVISRSTTGSVITALCNASFQSLCPSSTPGDH